MMPDALRLGGLAPRVIPIETCLERATQLARSGRRWHSHVLSPGCEHNPYPELYAVLIEDDTAGEAYLATSKTFPEVDKQLVKMLHGASVLDMGAGGRVRPENSPLLTRLVDLQARGVRWHHHMCFPTCVLNPERGRWSIAVESDDGPFWESFIDEPLDVLREVEILYFRNLEAGGA